jgi:putative FmdB family regulatory protein
LPVYEYECQSCGKRFDVMQKLSDPPVTECTFCKGGVRKLLGTPALQFKGSGWYITDYAGKSPKPEGAAPSKDSPAPAGTKSGPAKTDTPACACSSKGCGSTGK